MLISIYIYTWHVYGNKNVYIYNMLGKHVYMIYIIPMHVHIHMHLHIQIHTHTHTHIHIHTHVDGTAARMIYAKTFLACVCVFSNHIADTCPI